jgi:hypothetical protein
VQTYVSAVSGRQLQQRLVHFLAEINRKELNFEEVSIPTIPNGQVIFEFGIAEEGNFNYLNVDETKRLLAFIAKAQVASLDFFCSIRYYKISGKDRQALKFDYYLLRTLFGKGTFEAQVFHEKGPRYLSPEDLVELLIKGANGDSNKRILKEANT